MVIGRALDVLAANRVARVLHPSYRPDRNLAASSRTAAPRSGGSGPGTGSTPSPPGPSASVIRKWGSWSFRYSFFGVSGSERQDLIVYHPVPGSRHTRSLALLGTLAAAAAWDVGPAEVSRTALERGGQ